jgi:hypothetical protein
MVTYHGQIAHVTYHRWLLITVKLLKTAHITKNVTQVLWQINQVLRLIKELTRMVLINLTRVTRNLLNFGKNLNSFPKGSLKRS